MTDKWRRRYFQVTTAANEAAKECSHSASHRFATFLTHLPFLPSRISSRRCGRRSIGWRLCPAQPWVPPFRRTDAKLFFEGAAELLHAAESGITRDLLHPG